VAELDDGRRTTLISSDTELSSEAIFLYYLHRWSIESYFKTAKQHFSLGKAGLSTEDGHKHWIILVILAKQRGIKCSKQSKEQSLCSGLYSSNRSKSTSISISSIPVFALLLLLLSISCYIDALRESGSVSFVGS